ncbi:hypothetical protein JNUCC1_02291 [Lentibacillus sp. JNUCC-1]|nr:hypothetical protein [Lentibacillus sp. JNUCC-1]
MHGTPSVQGGNTIFEAFSTKQKSKIKLPRVRDLFDQWRHTKPGIYKISEAKDDYVQAVDLISNESFTVYEPELTDNMYAIGFLFPYTNYYKFFVSPLMFPEDLHYISDLAVDYHRNNQFVHDFPAFLGEALLVDESEERTDASFDNPVHLAVFQLYEQHMRTKSASDEAINFGAFLWYQYCELKDPLIRKAGPYAATLDYLTQDLEPPMTQKELAEEYDTSASTISQNVRKIDEAIGEELSEMDLDNEQQSADPRMGMEQMMNNIQQMLSEQEFETEEEVNAFLNHLLQNQDEIVAQSHTDRDKAQDKLYEAAQTSGEKRQKLIEEAFKLYPNSPDAYFLMAEDQTSLVKQYELLLKGIEAGKKDLGPEFFEENKGHFWSMIETRPYMRVKAALAKVIDLLGDTERAIQEFEEMLELNPNDNQGVRYDLLTLYIEGERFDAAKQLLKQYESETSAAFLFNKVLISYFTKGMTNTTRSLLKEANTFNPHVKEYLIGRKKIPLVPPDKIGSGDKNEAIAYADENSYLWDGEKELINELKKL